MNGLVGGPLLVGDLEITSPSASLNPALICAVFGGSPPSFYFTTLRHKSVTIGRCEQATAEQVLCAFVS